VPGVAHHSRSPLVSWLSLLTIVIYLINLFSYLFVREISYRIRHESYENSIPGRFYETTFLLNSVLDKVYI
jgi:hypothetical protein